MGHFNSSLYYIFMLCCNYEEYSSITYSQGFQEDINLNLTFGFKISEEFEDKITYELLDSNNIKIEQNLIKKCDENLNEIEEYSNIKNKYICLKNYEIKRSNISNHVFKINLYEKDSINLNELPSGVRYPLIIRYKEPIIKHKEKNPFDYNIPIYENTYFYPKNELTSYRNYIKVMEYPTKEIPYIPFFYKEKYDLAVFLEDFFDSSY